MQATHLTSIQWIWRHIAFNLPAGWEMLQFSSEFNRGRCAFADRYQFRAELNWSVVSGEPDYDRMISNYTSRFEQEKKLTDAERLKKSGWHGFSGIINGEPTSRFGLFLEPIGCLVEWVFIWPDARDPDMESEILAATRAMPLDREGLQPWRAFGLDMRLPPEAAFEGVTVQPAKVEFSFTDPKTGNAWRFGRLGMVNLWLKSSLEDWFTTLLKPGTRNLRFSHRQIRNTDIIHAEGEFTPEGMHLRRGNIEAAAWVDPMDGRIYHARKLIRKLSNKRDVPLDALLHAAPEFTPKTEIHGGHS